MRVVSLRMIISSVMFFLCSLLPANDCLYTVSGNHLVPLKETGISVTKEVLTITLDDDEMATVDVYYEFFNNGGRCKVLMGFEAPPLMFQHAEYRMDGGNPFITDFSVVMNGRDVGYDVNVTHGVNFEKYEDFAFDYSYVYSFKAKFRKGKNIVRHRYKYKVSKCLDNIFNVSYMLTPATRWANHQVDDFTLVIDARDTYKHFVIPDDVFSGGVFTVTDGVGKTRKNSMPDGKSVTEVVLRNGVLQWHAHAFSPQEELSVMSADCLSRTTYSDCFGLFFDRSESFLISLRAFGYYGVPLSERALRVIHSLPLASRGFVFDDPELRGFYEGQWWYMPDASYTGETTGFTPSELRCMSYDGTE